MAMGAIVGIAAWTRGQERIIRTKYDSNIYSGNDSFDSETDRRIQAARQRAANK